MNYLPLKEFLTIKQSEINGLGLFATADIKENTSLGLSHILGINGSLYRTPLGGFYNHSDKPNAVKVYSGQFWKLITIKDIKAGDEITVDYTFYKI